MPVRKYTAGNGYRYGFNGKEMDNEVKGEGNQQDYGMRISDPRLGRFLSVDPLTSTYPWYTPYQFAGNMPIIAVDLDGAEPEIVVNKAAEYIGTIYEWGGKNPTGKWKASYPKLQAQIRTIILEAKLDHVFEDEYFDESFNLLLRNISRAFRGVNSVKRKKELYELFNSLKLVNPALFDEVKFGKSSFGIDCSGLSRFCFNADNQKLMTSWGISRAVDQFKTFNGATDEGTGIIHSNFNFIGEGDIVFNVNNKRDDGVTHVMVATGNVKTDKKGNVIKFEVIHAPESGQLVKREWKKVSTKLSIGHTYRIGDQTTPFKNAITDDEAIENSIKVRENLEEFRKKNQYVKTD